MKYICDGMEYNFDKHTGKLRNNYKSIVAVVGFGDNAEEYWLAEDFGSGQIMATIHVGLVPDDYALGRWLVQQYSVYRDIKMDYGQNPGKAPAFKFSLTPNYTMIYNWRTDKWQLRHMPGYNYIEDIDANKFKTIAEFRSWAETIIKELES